MKRNGRPVALTAVLVLAMLGNGMQQRQQRALASEASPAAKVQVNDTLVSFSDVQPYINEHGQMMVPVRSVAEALGAEVTADAETGHVRISRRGSSMDLLVGTDIASVDGLPERLAGKVRLQNGRVIVPLRSLLRWSRLHAVWDESEMTAIIREDGRRYAPVGQTQPHRIVETADDYLGVPYVWGGSKPAGFDCSGFVQYVYRKHGVDLPRTSKEMFATVGDFIPAAELEPGDLVFFAERSGSSRATSHVGIYIGDNRFISATNSYGVKVSNLNGTYWGPQYIGAKRVL